MWGKCTKYCRLLVLSLIIVVTAIILHFNKKNISVEKFTNSVEKKTNYTRTINKMYRDILARNATEFEVEKSMQIMKSEMDETTLIEIIKKTEEYREKNNLDVAIKKTIGTSDRATIDKALNSMKLKERVEIYRNIIDVYERTLQRVPIIMELNYYAYRMTTDKNFDIQKLETILTSSNEYKIIEKNQSNVVNFELKGNITDAQLKYEVVSIYKFALGVDTDPSYELEQFLKKKYVDYQMEKDKLVRLILLMNMIDNNQIPNNIEGILSDGNNTEKIISGSSSSLGNNGADNSQNTMSDIEKENIKRDLMNAIKKISETCPNQDFKETMKCINNGGFNIDENIANNGESSLASFQLERNNNKMKDMMTRECKYLNADDNMVLFPEFKWDVPQKRPPVCYFSEQNNVSPSIDQTALIGTLLQDSKKTSVGSIMPEFEFTENVKFGC
jgi:hypothetical protein